MIEVIAHYYHKKTSFKKPSDYFIFPYFMVKGHANNGTSEECIRLCSGVSACVLGMKRLFNYQQYEVTYKTGFFEVRLKQNKDIGDNWVDRDTCYGLNTLLCQLYELFQLYPHQFSKFDMIEVKENKEIYGEQKLNKPIRFRKLKEKRMGLNPYFQESDIEED